MTDFRLEGEIRVPEAALIALSESARRYGEPVAAAVREAGRAAGENILRRIRTVVSLVELDMADFWLAVNAETGARGLGRYEWQSAIGGHAELLVDDVPDDRGPIDTGSSDRSAPFTEGFVEGLLGAAAEEPVAVVQAPPDGSGSLRYVVGAPSALRHVRLRLQAGATLEQALEGI
jgi:hypothetical protein